MQAIRCRAQCGEHVRRIPSEHIRWSYCGLKAAGEGSQDSLDNVIPPLVAHLLQRTRLQENYREWRAVTTRVRQFRPKTVIKIPPSVCAGELIANSSLKTSLAHFFLKARVTREQHECRFTNRNFVALPKCDRVGQQLAIEPGAIRRAQIRKEENRGNSLHYGCVFTIHPGIRQIHVDLFATAYGDLLKDRNHVPEARAAEYEQVRNVFGDRCGRTFVDLAFRQVIWIDWWHLNLSITCILRCEPEPLRTSTKREHVRWRSSDGAREKFAITCHTRQVAYILSYKTLRKPRGIAKLRRLVATEFSRLVAKRMRQARERAGWTQAQLAAALEIEAATLSRYESGKFPAPTDLLWRMSCELGIRLSQLIDVENELPKALTAPASQGQRQIRTGEEKELFENWSRLSPRDRRVVVQLCRVMVRAREE